MKKEKPKNLVVLNSVAPLLLVLGGAEIPTAAVVAAGAVAVGAVVAGVAVATSKSKKKKAAAEQKQAEAKEQSKAEEPVSKALETKEVPVKEAPAEPAIKEEPKTVLTEQEPVSLSESLKIAATVASNGIVSKETVVSYLSEAHGGEVEINHRDNYVSNGRLMLADTHYTLMKTVNGEKVKGAKTCFVYVYENSDGGVMLLVKVPASFAASLKENHANVNLSAFPKTKDEAKWYSVPADDTWTAEQLYAMLTEVKALNEGEAVQHTELRSVSVAQADALMTDEEVGKIAGSSGKKADRTKKIVVNIGAISEAFKDGETVNLGEIKKRISGTAKNATYVKILASGVLDKKLTVEADEISASARKMIVLLGGKIILSDK